MASPHFPITFSTISDLPSNISGAGRPKGLHGWIRAGEKTQKEKRNL